MPFKIVVAGGGIAGNTFAGALLQRSDENLPLDLELRVYEANPQDVQPLGVNILLNHNGLASLHEIYPALYQRLINLPTASPMKNWSARTVDGEILYHLTDVTTTTTTSTNNNQSVPPLAVVPALVAQWNQVFQATRTDKVQACTVFGTKVTNVVAQDDGKVKVRLEQQETRQELWEEDVDLVVAADGRYSILRQALAPSSPTDYGPPSVIDFRIIVEAPDDDDDHNNTPVCPLVQQVLRDHLSPKVPMWRVYNKPSQQDIGDRFGHSPGVRAAREGYTRVGIMRLGPQSLGLYGNIALPPGDATVDPVIQTPEFMAAILESPAADDFGRLTVELVRKYGHTAYWARKQQTDTCYTALDNRVLFVGDSAGGIYPSLGQGANLSLEDAIVAATVFPDVARIGHLRHGRREFIKELSMYHARHLCEDAEQFDTEMIQWRGEQEPLGRAWHVQLRRLWNPRLALRAVTATAETWAPFGQLIGESLDGDLYDPVRTDAALDLSLGTPRLYYMKLEGGRPLRVDCITRHHSVTQCLGALGNTEDFYLVVHRPDQPLSLQGLRAFRIPPRHFVKLHRGTWHVGPLWTGADPDRTFINLELADTNQVDHDKVEFSTLAGLTDSKEGNETLVIPVMPVPVE